MKSRTDAIELVWWPATGPPRRIIAEPRSDGHWEFTESVHTGCAWRPTGSQMVTDVQLDAPDY